MRKSPPTKSEKAKLQHERLSIRMKELWATPEFREKMSKRKPNSGVTQSKKMKELNEKNWANPEYRIKKSLDTAMRCLEGKFGWQTISSDNKKKRLENLRSSYKLFLTEEDINGDYKETEISI